MRTDFNFHFFISRNGHTVLVLLPFHTGFDVPPIPVDSSNPVSSSCSPSLARDRRLMPCRTFRYCIDGSSPSILGEAFLQIKVWFLRRIQLQHGLWPCELTGIKGSLQSMYEVYQADYVFNGNCRFVMTSSCQEPRLVKCHNYKRLHMLKRRKQLRKCERSFLTSLTQNNDIVYSLRQKRKLTLLQQVILLKTLSSNKN